MFGQQCGFSSIVKGILHN